MHRFQPIRFILVCVMVCFAPLLQAATTGGAGSGAPLENRQPTVELNYMICTSGLYPQADGVINRLTEGGGFFISEVRLFAANFVPAGWLPCDGRLLQINSNQALFTLIGTTYGGDGVSTFALPDLRGRVPIGVSSDFPLGTVVGSASPTLTLDQIPAHAHALGPISTSASGGGASFDNRQPGLALHHVLIIEGDFSELGEVVMLAGTVVPFRNPRCNGQILFISQYTALFSRLGATFGGNGSTNFALPDLRGRAVIGEGAAAGLSSYSRGNVSGAASITLQPGQLPLHAHSFGTTSTSLAGGFFSVDNRQPTLALNRQIVVNGLVPIESGAGDDPFLADVRTFAGFTDPDNHPNFLPADGRLLPSAEYDALTFVLGSRYGGNGSINVGLPDLRGRLVAGAATPSSPGANYGVESFSLTTDQIPYHTHEVVSARESWRLEHFGTSENAGDAADNAAPRGDGVPNLLKFATGLDPALPATQPGALAQNGGSLEFVYPRSSGALTELQFTVEWSDTLATGSWTSADVSESVVTTINGVQTVKATLPLGPSGRRFVRLRVTAL